ncbi:MAG TPA: Glu/Leu/Phe/Val dehydrogenase dimerization domain-containing protein [Actinomycetota bacterium]|nr:Glu/Leu/Phe/Val dehydrogenase dimerization domain-containing protein [Actinomycetota bacterium]
MIEVIALAGMMAGSEPASGTRGRVSKAVQTGWDGERIATATHPGTGARLFVFIHSTRLGPACGGTRMRVYPSIADAMADGMRLAAGMTRKNAVAGLPLGGGKAVIAVPELPTGAARRDLFHRYGDLVNSLGGEFLTGVDMNTTPEDFDVMGDVSPYAFTRTAERGGSGDASPYTALGVLHGIRASVERVFGSPDVGGRSVLVQGVGAVGSSLARLLTADGARVGVSDLDGDRARAVAAEIGAAVVPAGSVLRIEADVLAPCAAGGLLNERSISTLGARVVAGSANNQLGTPEDADRLHRAGILYAPDYVISAGGVLQAVGLDLLGWSADHVRRRVAGIGDTLREVYEMAREHGTSTEAAAAALADRRLAEASAGRESSRTQAPGHGPHRPDASGRNRSMKRGRRADG